MQELTASIYTRTSFPSRELNFNMARHCICPTSEQDLIAMLGCKSQRTSKDNQIQDLVTACIQETLRLERVERLLSRISTICVEMLFPPDNIALGKTKTNSGISKSPDTLLQ